MCDIGRFQYIWVESEQRLRKPLILTKDGVHQTATWKDALVRVRDLVDAAGRKDPASVRFLASAHASHEELFLLKQLAEGMKGDGGASHVHVAWRRTEKQQPADTQFRVPATDAPNVTGAEVMGFAVGGGLAGESDLQPLVTAVDENRVAVLYVVDPGPDGSMGDLSWVTEARKSGRLGVVIYQGVLSTELSKVADVILPGSAWVEKDATYTNDQGQLQAASKVINPPGEAVDDWQILTSVAVALGLPFTFKSSRDVRVEIANVLGQTPGFSGLGDLTFNRALALQHWLQASNPMERWKWNVMFQDLPPVKGHNVQMEAAPQPSVIPLKLVTEEIARAE
jgi:predicted molibdopterin-dependent oxidoreductase YjgC